MNVIDQYCVTIHEEGRIAYNRGEDTEVNPHERGTPEHDIWFHGWAQEADSDPKQKL